MSLFKEQVAADIVATFINFDEFATEHNVNGTLLYLVLDEDVNKERLGLKTGIDTGVYLKHIAFFVALFDLGYIPAENDYIEFDGKKGIVASCQNEDGVLYIVLEVNES